MDGVRTLLDDIHRREHNFLPAAFPRPSRHATPLHRLSRCIRRLEYGVILRCLPNRDSDNLLRLCRVLYIVLWPSRRRQLLECTTTKFDVGMDCFFSTSVPPIRSSAKSKIELPSNHTSNPALCGVFYDIEPRKFAINITNC